MCCSQLPLRRSRGAPLLEAWLVAAAAALVTAGWAGVLRPLLAGEAEGTGEVLVLDEALWLVGTGDTEPSFWLLLLAVDRAGLPLVADVVIASGVVMTESLGVCGEDER